MRPSAGASRVTVAGLVLANTVPLVGVLGYGWGVHSILVAYWLESGVVGAASVAKIRRAEGQDDPAELPPWSVGGTRLGSLVGEPNREVERAFVGNYAVFFVVYGGFVLGFALLPGIAPASPRVVAAAAVTLGAYHALSYRLEYVGRREYERTGPVTLMVEPYRRVLVLSVTIVLGAAVVALFGAPAGALAVLVATKTALDLRAHRRERDRKRAEPTAG